MPPTSLPLNIARQKLLAGDVPMQLRAVAYIRLSCAALESKGFMYASLMRVLFTYNPGWWKTCGVTTTGILRSSDPLLNELLSPITELHRQEVHASHHKRQQINLAA